ncbi:MAG: two-component regulator propeller domain-containing protein [Planctomycetaceae bacterium]
MSSVCLVLALICEENSSLPGAEVSIEVPEFKQPFHVPYSLEQGLPEDGVRQVAVTAEGGLIALDDRGQVYYLDEEEWKRLENSARSKYLFDKVPAFPTLSAQINGEYTVRDVAIQGDEIAVATSAGLYLGDGEIWHLALPQQGNTRWAPVDVRAVTYDNEGQLWFAAPQGVGCRQASNEWLLFTGSDGLPFNDFTCIAAGPDGVWFGTTNGAIQYENGNWHFRQGGRWLLDNHVLDIAVDANGSAWIATSKGISCIAQKTMTLAEKADFYEAEIEKYHRRTEYGYVNPALLSEPGDRSTAKATYSDNDGFNTGLYLAAVSFGYKATNDPELLEYAHRAFASRLFKRGNPGGTVWCSERFYCTKYHSHYRSGSQPAF